MSGADARILVIRFDLKSELDHGTIRNLLENPEIANRVGPEKYPPVTVVRQDAVFTVAVHRQPAEMVNEVVSVSPLRSLAVTREEPVGTIVNRTTGDVEHEVRALPASMVDELYANVVRCLGPVCATIA